MNRLLCTHDSEIAVIGRSIASNGWAKAGHRVKLPFRSSQSPSTAEDMPSRSSGVAARTAGRRQAPFAPAPASGASRHPLLAPALLETCAVISDSNHPGQRVGPGSPCAPTAPTARGSGLTIRPSKRLTSLRICHPTRPRIDATLTSSRPPTEHLRPRAGRTRTGHQVDVMSAEGVQRLSSPVNVHDPGVVDQHIERPYGRARCRPRCRACQAGQAHCTGSRRQLVGQLLQPLAARATTTTLAPAHRAPRKAAPSRRPRHDPALPSSRRMRMDPAPAHTP